MARRLRHHRLPAHQVHLLPPRVCVAVRRLVHAARRVPLPVVVRAAHRGVAIVGAHHLPVQRRRVLLVCRLERVLVVVALLHAGLQLAEQPSEVVAPIREDPARAVCGHRAVLLREVLQQPVEQGRVVAEPSATPQGPPPSHPQGPPGASTAPAPASRKTRARGPDVRGAVPRAPSRSRARPLETAAEGPRPVGGGRRQPRKHGCGPRSDVQILFWARRLVGEDF